MTGLNNWNDKIIAEFRANAGKVGGQFEGAPMLLLHTTGAKSGIERVNPVVYQKLDGGGLAVFASKAGAPEHPAWFHNLVANPAVTVEVGVETVPMAARVAAGSEREGIWEAQKKVMPGFADYAAKTEREIPVVLLEPAQSA